MAYIGKTPTPAPLTSSDVTDGIITTAKIADGIEVVDWQSVETGATFTAVAGNGYPVNTTAQACTVTLPAGSVGDTIQLVDYAGTWDTNAVTLTADGSEKIKGLTLDVAMDGEREAVTITYVDATQGWITTSAANETAPAIQPPGYDVEYLIVGAGGGGGFSSGGSGGGGGGGAGGYRTNYDGTAVELRGGTTYTVTVGGGGAGGTSGAGTNGGDSSLSGTGITTITSTGGGAGSGMSSGGGEDGGSGGGGDGASSSAGGSGNTPSTTPSQGNDGGSAGNGGGGGGGATAVGANASVNVPGAGGNGTAVSITGSSVTYAGGGGGGAYSTSSGQAVASGGGGRGGNGNGNGSITGGTDGLGGGGGGAGGGSGTNNGAIGGDGTVILRMADGDAGTPSGEDSVATDVGGSGETVITWIATGSYVG